MVNTRPPIERLIDWTDQAVLILLLDDGTNDSLDPRVEQLRRIGVRTASSILHIASDPAAASVRENVEEIVGSGDAGLTLDVLASQIEREPAMGRILQWLRSDLAEVDHERKTIEVGAGPTKVAG